MTPGAGFIALLHGLHVAVLLVLFGGLAIALPPGMPRRSLRRLLAAAAATALLLGLGWFLAVTAELADARGLGQTLAAVPDMLSGLRFARLLVLRLGLLAALALPIGRRARFALAALALGIEPWLGHAGAAIGAEGRILTAAELVHVLAAGLWLGGLPALWIALRAAPAEALPGLLGRFGRVAQWAVTAILVSGAIQASYLLGGWGRILGTFYGRTLLLKTALLAAMLALAAANRFALVPRLVLPSGGAPVIRGRLMLSVALETALGLALVLAAGRLAQLPPGAEQVARLAPAGPAWVGVALGLAGAAIALGLARPPAAPPPRHEATTGTTPGSKSSLSSCEPSGDTP